MMRQDQDDVLFQSVQRKAIKSVIIQWKICQRHHKTSEVVLWYITLAADPLNCIRCDVDPARIGLFCLSHLTDWFCCFVMFSQTHSWIKSASWQRSLFCRKSRVALGNTVAIKEFNNVYFAVTSRGVPGPKQGIAQSITLPLQSRLLPIMHPGTNSYSSMWQTSTRASTWCNIKCGFLFSMV